MGKLNKSLQDVIDDTSKMVHKEEIYIDGRHEYNYHKFNSKQSTVHELYHSDNEEWSLHIRNTIAMKLIDNGDGIELNSIDFKKTIDYLQTEQLHILLRLSSHESIYQISEPAIKRNF